MKPNYFQRWRLEQLLPRISAFNGLPSLVHSMTAHRYVPTLSVYADDDADWRADRLEAAAIIVAAGGTVFVNGRLISKGGAK